MILPLEGITKDQVREIARSNDLINADRKDSTDVCFITNNFKEYMSDKLENKPGDVILIDTNEIIGKHDGLFKYTIGQRKGLNIGGASSRMFVVSKDLVNNILYVGLGDDNKHLYSNSCILEKVNFNTLERPNKCSARFRYRAPLYDVDLVYLDDGEVLVKYDGIKSVTAGQACVFYDGDQCLGGGIIKETSCQ